jgi:hypothetical protein
VFASVRPLREDARLRTARDRIDTIVREGRELAMRFGEPVAVVFDPATGRLEATGLEQVAGDGVLGAAAAVTEMVDVAAIAAGPDPADPAEAAIRPSIDLDRRLHLTMRPPAADVGSWSDADRGEDAGFDPWAGGGLEAWPLAVFLPDGTMLLSRTAWLRPAEVESAGAAATESVSPGWRLRIHPWTGEPIWMDEAAAGLTGEAFDASDEEFEPVDAFDEAGAFDAFDAPGGRPEADASPSEFGP